MNALSLVHFHIGRRADGFGWLLLGLTLIGLLTWVVERFARREPSKE
jgi:flagellar biogenesis protein FliO